MMQWKDEDDTSENANPLYMNRGKVHIGFGKGYIVFIGFFTNGQAGVDFHKQRKESQYMESLLSIREQAVELFAVFDLQENAQMPMNHNSEDLNRQLVESIQKRQMEQDEAVFIVKEFHQQSEQRDGTGAGSQWHEKALSAMTQRDWRIMREEFDIRVQGARAINPLRFWNEAAIHPSILKAIEKLG